MDVFLIICVLVLTFLLIIINIYLLSYYCHPDDKGFGTSLFCKALVIFGLTLSWAQVLMLPLDVSNSRYDGGGLDMKSFWLFLYMIIAVFIIFLLPTAIYLYESDETKPMGSRIWYACFLELCTIIIVSLILFISYSILRYTDIPVTIIGSSITNLSSSTAMTTDDMIFQQSSDESLEMPVSFWVYTLSLICFIGSFFFVIFGSIGLCALPMDLIFEFIKRPVYRSSKEAMEAKNMLKLKSKELITEGKQLKDEEKDAKLITGQKIEIQLIIQSIWGRRKKINQIKAKITKYKNAALYLEKEFEIFSLEVQIKDVNPVWYFIKLILGAVFSIVSLLWWLHILLYILFKKGGKPASQFLNAILNTFYEAHLSFLSTAVYGFFCLYLLWATTKGNFKVGVRIPCLFSIHLMRKDETWMNSFLFNVMIILICSVSLTKFCTVAFLDFSRLTTIDNLFGIQIQYLRFYKYFFENKIFEFAFFVLPNFCIYCFIQILMTLSFFVLLWNPRDKPQIIKEIESKRQEQKKIRT